MADLKRAFNSIKRKLADKIRPEPPLVLNEAINFDKKVIFIAIPKTGTTSIRKQLQQEGRAILNAPHLNIMQVRELIYLHKLRSYLGANNNTIPNNTLTDQELRIEGMKLFDDLFKFSAVRNPWARAVSLYYRREGFKVQNAMSFEDFCQSHLYASDTSSYPTLHRNQLDWLVDENGKVIMDFVYKVEEFDEAIARIDEMTNGRLKLSSRFENVNPNSKSNSYRDMYNEESKRLIGQRFEKDIDTFKYTF